MIHYAWNAPQNWNEFFEKMRGLAPTLDRMAAESNLRARMLSEKGFASFSKANGAMIQKIEDMYA